MAIKRGPSRITIVECDKQIDALRRSYDRTIRLLVTAFVGLLGGIFTFR